METSLKKEEKARKVKSKKGISSYMIDLISDYIYSSDTHKKKQIMGELRILIDDGADLNVKSSDGELPLCTVAFSVSSETAREKAQGEARLEMAMLLIRNGANVNEFNGEGHSPLMSAMYWWCVQDYRRPSWKKDVTIPDDNFWETISLLIEFGASTTLANNAGITAFHLAAQADSPQILALLRKHVDREPLNVVEALLFSGHDSCMKMLEKSRGVDNYQLEKTFEYAVRLQDVELIEYLAAKKIDIVSSLTPLRVVHQTKSGEKTFELDLLKFMARFPSGNMELFWRHVLIVDHQLRSCKIAEKWLTETLGEVKTAEILSERNKYREEAYKHVKSQTNKFINFLHDLFINLRTNHILAFDIDGSGWAPGDHGWEVAFDMATDKDLRDFGVAYSYELPICYTDTKFYKKEARMGRRGRLLKPVTSAYIYYDPTNKNKAKKMAKCIVDTAKGMGFIVNWSGDVHKAITVSL